MWNRKRTDRELAVFSQKLGQLLEAGFPLLTGLALVQRSSSRKMAQEIQGIIQCLQDGLPFSAGIKKIRFPPFYCFFVAAAEQNGQYAEALRQLYEYYLNKDKRRKKLSKALAYPCFILLTSLFSFFLIVYGLVPQFSSLYQSFSLQLPWVTRFMLDFSEGLVKYQIFMFIVPLTGVLVGWGLLHRKRLHVEKFLLKLPICSKIFKLQLSSMISIQMGFLLEGGVSILTICGLFSEEGHWLVVRQSFDQIQQILVKGNKLSAAFAQSPYYLPVLQEMILISEEAGTLAVCLLQLGEQLEEELDHCMERYAARVETYAILGAGIFITFIMLSLFVPMFDFIEKF